MSRPLVAAHRGGALLWPENSLRAYQGALALGVDFVETDVHLTADGAPVLLHDATLDRTTTGRGPVRAFRWADLKDVRLRERDGQPTNEALPLLTQLVDLVAPSRAGLLLELKADGRGARYPGLEERALAEVRSRDLTGRTVVMAFEDDTLHHVRALDATIRTALLVGRRRLPRGPGRLAVEWAHRLGVTHLGLEYRLIDAGTVEAARQRELTLLAWTVNAERDMGRMVELGVDILVTDRPDLALRLVRP